MVILRLQLDHPVDDQVEVFLKYYNGYFRDKQMARWQYLWRTQLAGWRGEMVLGCPKKWGLTKIPGIRAKGLDNVSVNLMWYDWLFMKDWMSRMSWVGIFQVKFNVNIKEDAWLNLVLLAAKILLVCNFKSGWMVHRYWRKPLWLDDAIQEDKLEDSFGEDYLESCGVSWNSVPFSNHNDVRLFPK